MATPMPMKWWFHSDVQGLHLLFEPLALNSPARLLGGYIFTIAICWSERAITFYLEGTGSRERKSRWRTALSRTLLYAVATTLRLWYMLITMYFNAGLFLVVVIALSSAQLVVETLKSQNSRRPGDGYTSSTSTLDCNRCTKNSDADEERRLLSDQQAGDYELTQTESSSKT